MTLGEFTKKYRDHTNTSLLRYAVEQGIKGAYGADFLSVGRRGPAGDLDDLELERYLTPEVFMLGICATRQLLISYERALLVDPSVREPVFSLVGSEEVRKLDTKPYDEEHFLSAMTESRLSDSRNFVTDLLDKLEEAVRENDFIYPAELAGWVAAGIDESRWQRSQGTARRPAGNSELGEFIRKYKSAGTELRKIISGQDAAIDTVIRALTTGAVTVGRKNAPEATFLFTGPPGVGKTFLARSLADLIGRPFKELSMSTFADDQDFHRLVGFDKTYKRSERGVLTEFLDSNPDAVILFDEIEKAHRTTILQFLSMLDGGYVHDVYEGKDIDCRKAIFIFTTNAGRSLYSGNTGTAYEQQDENAIRAALSKDPAFPPEILSRLSSGNIVPFSSLSLSSIRDVIRGSLEKCRNELESNTSTEISLDADLPEYLLCTGSMSQDARIAAGKSRDFLASLFTEAFNHADDLSKFSIRIDHSQPMARAGEGDPADDEENVPANDNKTFDQFIRSSGADPCRILMVDYKKSASAVREVFGEDDVICYQSMKDCYNDDFQLEPFPTAANFDAIFVNPYFGAKKNGARDATGIREGNAKIFLRLLESGVRAADLTDPSVPLRLVIIDDEHPEHTADDDAAYKRCYNTIRDIIHVPTRDALPAALKAVMPHEDIQSSITELIKHGRRLTNKDPEWRNEGDSVTAVISGLREVYALDADLGQTMVSIEHPDGGFDDIYGAEEAKAGLSDYIEFLKDPDRWYGFGIDPPKGVLLWGEPGTGKTKLARTLAGEVHCPYFQTTGSEILNRGSEYLSELFATARKYSPSVLFIDEIDVAGLARSGMGDHRDIIVNTFLTEMDGFTDNKSQPVLVIAATNLPRSLDSALRRRFDNEIRVHAPDKATRRAYLTDLNNNNGKLSNVEEADLEVFIESTIGATIADLERIIRLAQFKAFRRYLAQDGAGNAAAGITGEILLDALEEFMFGIERESDPGAKVRTAYHEIGHALLTKLYYGNTPYVTIVSRQDFNGYSSRPEIDEPVLTRDRLCKDIRIGLAGRECERLCAEEIRQTARERFGRELTGEFWINSGASSDLEKSVSRAARMVCIYGMDDVLLPLPDASEKDLACLPPAYYEAVKNLVEQERRNCVKDLEAHREQIRILADMLMEKSSLNDSDLTGVLEG